MVNISKASVIILVAVMISLSGSMSCCADSNPDLKTFRGTVQEIDWVGSLLTVEGVDEVTFYVPPGTKIINGIETISLSSIEQSDVVLIKYYDDQSGRSTAVRISVESAYPSF